MTKKEKKELEALRARYADDVRGRVSVRERLMEAVGGWGPSLAIMGAASYFAGAGLLEAAWGMGDAIGFFGVFVGKALGVGGVAFTASPRLRKSLRTNWTSLVREQQKKNPSTAVVRGFVFILTEAAKVYGDEFLSQEEWEHVNNLGVTFGREYTSRSASEWAAERKRCSEASKKNSSENLARRNSTSRSPRISSANSSRSSGSEAGWISRLPSTRS
jgi:hypothetical protein